MSIDQLCCINITFIPDGFDISKYFHLVRDEMAKMIYTPEKETLLLNMEHVENNIKLGMYELIYEGIVDYDHLTLYIIYEILKQLDLIVFEKGFIIEYNPIIFNINNENVKNKFKTIASGGWGIKQGGWGHESKV